MNIITPDPGPQVFRVTQCPVRGDNLRKPQTDKTRPNNESMYCVLSTWGSENTFDIAILFTLYIVVYSSIVLDQ